MVRNYKKKTVDDPKNTDEDMVRAIVAVNEGATFGAAAKAFYIPKTSLIRHYMGKDQSPRKFGCKTA